MTAGSSLRWEQLLSPLQGLLQKPWCKNGFNLTVQNNVSPPPKLVTTGKTIASCLANPCLIQGSSSPFRVQIYLSSSPGTWWNGFLTSPTLQFQTVLAFSSQKMYIRPTALALTLMLTRWSYSCTLLRKKGSIHMDHLYLQSDPQGPLQANSSQRRTVVFFLYAG